MNERLYFDWNATAPLRPEARSAFLAALGVTGNPSSVHAEGRAARRLIEDAREHVASLVGAQPRNVVFTSGGTEANVLALRLADEPSIAPVLSLAGATANPAPAPIPGRHRWSCRHAFGRIDAPPPVN